MKQLHHSGLPLYLDDDGVMALKPPLTPAKTTPSVISREGVFSTISLRAALISPVRSATPTPSIATRTVPRGAKPVKLVTADEKMCLMPAAESSDPPTILNRFCARDELSSRRAEPANSA